MPLPEDFLDRVPTQNEDVAWRIVDDECIIIDPLGSQATVLNSVGARVWVLLDGKSTVRSVIASIHAEHEVSPEVAEQDVREFLASLVEKKLVQL